MNITYAGIYDALVPQPSHELTFYRDYLSKALIHEERVLVTPSTTGRLCIALAKQGFRVTGIDLDPEMTTMAQAKKAQLPATLQARLHFKTGDMCKVKTTDPYGAVVIPERGLLCLNDKARWQAIAGFSRILRLGGLLIFDLSLKREAPLFCYNTDFRAPWQPEHQLSIQEAVEKVDSNGRVRQHIAISERDSDGNCVQAKEMELDLHFPVDGEIGKILKQSRFSAWQLYGDFHCRQGQQEDDYQIWIANRVV